MKDDDTASGVKLFVGAVLLLALGVGTTLSAYLWSPSLPFVLVMLLFAVVAFVRIVTIVRRFRD